MTDVNMSLNDTLELDAIIKETTEAKKKNHFRLN